MNLWEERAARNEALFREVNEQARGLSEWQRPDSDDELPFVCECSDDRCVERISLPLAAYEAVRANPRRFIIVPGHNNEFERVTDRADGYWIVEKVGQAGRVAEKNDPRT